MKYERMEDWNVRDRRVLDAIEAVPRHLFVGEADLLQAYEDHPLPIGEGQTISQPYIVALMTDLLEVGKHHRVLEVGSGSGFQAAVLAHLAEEVVTVEIIGSLADRCRERLKTLGVENVQVHHGDGHEGFPPKAPYDRIIVTASCREGIPGPLTEQLRPGGRMVLPVGANSEEQQLLVIEKDSDGRLREKAVLPVRFVPLTRRVR